MTSPQQIPSSSVTSRNRLEHDGIWRIAIRRLKGLLNVAGISQLVLHVQHMMHRQPRLC